MESPNYNVVDEQLADDDEEMEVQLPGFRFHPTDEELVGFYLRRKVENKPLTIELIKSTDIYKYDPWDLPKTSCTAGEKEWYFFCKRGRKYKNSIRPNRVTGSGFWKATGIDKPVHNLQQIGGANHKLLGNPNSMNIDQCIGLKKTLVYYRGSAGKGTKTDWMMHEFRLPALNNYNNKTNIRTNSATIDTLQEAEIWTLCRIFKRNVSYRKYTSDWRELSTKRSQQNMDTTSPKKYCNSAESNSNNNIISANNNNYNKSEANSYIDFSAVPVIFHEEKKPNITNHHHMINMNDSNSIVASDHHYHDRTNGRVLHVSQLSSMATTTTHINSNINNLDSSLSRISSLLFTDLENDHQLFSSTTYNTNWDELRAVVEYALDPDLM